MTKKIFTLLTALVLSIGIGWGYVVQPKEVKGGVSVKKVSAPQKAPQASWNWTGVLYESDITSCITYDWGDKLYVEVVTNCCGVFGFEFKTQYRDYDIDGNLIVPAGVYIMASNGSAVEGNAINGYTTTDICGCFQFTDGSNWWIFDSGKVTVTKPNGRMSINLYAYDDGNYMNDFDVYPPVDNVSSYKTLNVPVSSTSFTKEGSEFVFESTTSDNYTVTLRIKSTDYVGTYPTSKLRFFGNHTLETYITLPDGTKKECDKGEAKISSATGGGYNVDATLISTDRVQYTIVGTPKKYAISVSSNNTSLGTVNSSGSSFTEGTNSTIYTATPTAGLFDGWYEGETKLTNGSSFSITNNGKSLQVLNIQGDHTIEARFVASQGGNITVNQEGEGSVTGAGSYDGGAQVNLTATPADGYMFVMWKKNGVATDLTQNATVTCSGDATYTVVFKRKYQVTAVPADNTKGTATISPAPVNGYYYDGQQITLEATPANALCTFVKWQKNGADIQGGASLNVIVNANDSYVAVFDGIEATEIDIQAAMTKNHGGGWGYCFYYWAKTYGYDIQVIASDNWEWAAGDKVTISNINTSKSYINDHGTKVTFTDFTGDCYTENGKNVLEALVKGNNGKAYLLKLRGKTAASDDTAEDYNQTYTSVNKKLEHKGDNIWQASSQNGTGQKYSVTWCNHFFFKVDPTKTGDIPSGIYQLDDSQAIGTLISTNGSDYQSYGSYYVQSYLYYVPASGYAEVINTNGTYYIKFEGYSSRGYNYTATVGTKPITTHKVTFKNYDGTILQESQVEEGQTPSYSGTPTKESTVSTVYTFTGWDPAITAVGSEDQVYTATFSETTRQYAITINAATNGTIKVMNGNTEVHTGDKVDYNTVLTVTATGDEHYHFDAWTTGTGYVTPDADGKVTVTGDIKLGATFAIDQHTITINQVTGGTIMVMNHNTGLEVHSGDMVDYGTILELTADQEPSYVFQGWNIVGTYEEADIEGGVHEFDAPSRVVMDDPSTSFVTGEVYAISVGSDLTISAEFAKQLVVTLHGTEGGIIKISDGTNEYTNEGLSYDDDETKDCTFGDGVHLTLTLVPGSEEDPDWYDYGEWVNNYDDEETISEDLVREVTLTEDMDLYALFMKGNYTLIESGTGVNYTSLPYGKMIRRMTLQRSFKANTWSTVCLPFNYNFLTFSKYLNKVYELSNASVSGNTLHVDFYRVTTMRAGTPCMFYSETAVTNPVFEYVTFRNVQPSRVTKGDATYYGVLQEPHTLEGGNKLYRYISSNKVYYPTKNMDMTFDRCYFILTKELTNAPMRISIDEDTYIMSAEENEGNLETTKYIKDGVMYINRNGVEYDATGHLIKK